MTMPDRNSSIHGDEGMYDPEPYVAEALDNIVGTVMLFGQWPQPRTSVASSLGYAPRRVEFDLAEWLVEEYEPAEMARFMVNRLCRDDDSDMLELRTEQEIEAKLRKHFADSAILDAEIEELHHEAEEAK